MQIAVRAGALEGLAEELRPGHLRLIRDERVEAVTVMTLEEMPPDGDTHWSVRGRWPAGWAEPECDSAGSGGRLGKPPPGGNLEVKAQATRARRSANGSCAIPRFHLQFTPTSTSWINLVERWFAELTNRKLRSSVHRSVTEPEADIRIAGIGVARAVRDLYLRGCHDACRS